MALYNRSTPRTQPYNIAEHPFDANETITTTRELTEPRHTDGLSTCGVVEAINAAQHKQAYSKQQHADILIHSLDWRPPNRLMQVLPSHASADLASNARHRHPSWRAACSMLFAAIC
jgi:hypothetical protein